MQPDIKKNTLLGVFLNVSLDITNVCAQFCCCLNCALLVLAYKFGASKVLRRLSRRLASQLAPLPTKLKKHPFGCFLKFWCEQSTSAAHTPPRLATRPFADKIKKTPFWVFFKILVRAKGLEPSTSTLARLRSSQLSYARIAWGILTHIFPFCK